KLSRECQKIVTKLSPDFPVRFDRLTVYALSESLSTAVNSETTLFDRPVCRFIRCCILFMCVLCSVLLYSRHKGPQENYGLGLTVTVPAPESELLQAVQDVASDGIVQGSKEYNKDEYISGAEQADNVSVFPKWDGAGHVFYKVRKNALD